MIKDGWHKVYNYDVMVEDGIVLYGCDKDHTKTVYPYRSAWGGWSRIYKKEKLTLNALRSGCRRGTIALI